MGTPWMTHPKEGERIAADWLNILFGAPAPPIGVIGEVVVEPEDWIRPDPEWEHPDLGEKMAWDWLRLFDDGTTISAPAEWYGGDISAPKKWLRPRRSVSAATPPSTEPKSESWRAWMVSSHDTGPRGAWPEVED